MHQYRWLRESQEVAQGRNWTPDAGVVGHAVRCEVSTFSGQFATALGAGDDPGAATPASAAGGRSARPGGARGTGGRHRGRPRRPRHGGARDVRERLPGDRHRVIVTVTIDGATTKRRVTLKLR